MRYITSNPKVFVEQRYIALGQLAIPTILSCGFSSLSRGVTSYAVLPVAVTPTAYSASFALSETGYVAGWESVQGRYTPFTWSASAGGRFLSFPQTGSTFGYANSINDSGQVVGSLLQYRSPDFNVDEVQAIRWSDTGNYELLEGSDPTSSGASLVAANGTAFGASGNVTKMTKWQPNSGTFSTITPPLSGFNQYGLTDLTSDGSVLVGEWDTEGDDEHPFRFDLPNNVFTTLDLGGWEKGRATDIAASGKFIAGHLWTRSESFEGDIAARWNNGILQTLAPLNNDGISYAWGVNDFGQVAGTTQSSDLQYHATLWDAAGLPHDLNNDIDPNSGWYLTEAHKINNAGQIVGEGYHLIDGQWYEQAFFLQPTSIPDPTPSTTLLGFAPLLSLRRPTRRTPALSSLTTRN